MINRSYSLICAAVLCTALLACRDSAAPATPASLRPGPDPTQTITVAFCAARAPIWVAFQDSGGVWTRALPEGSTNTKTFRHEFSSNRGAIATVTPSIDDSTFHVVNVLYGAPDELAAAGDTSRVDCAAAGTKTLHGAVVGLDGSYLALIHLGLSSAAASVALGTDFALEQVPAGPQDLLATRQGRFGFPQPSLLRLILRRNIDLPDGGSIAPLDFASPEAFEATPATVTITNAGLTTISQNVLYTSNAQFTLPFTTDQTATTGSRQYYAVPESRLAPGEIQLLRVSAVGDDNRTLDAYFRAPVDRTLEFGAPLIAPTLTSITPAGATAPRVRAHFAAQPEYDRVTTIVYGQGFSSNVISVSMTPRYAVLVGGYDIDVPDFLSVPGYDPSWGLRAGEPISWQAFRVGGTLPYGRNAVPFDGATRIVSQRSDTITVR